MKKNNAARTSHAVVAIVLSCPADRVRLRARDPRAAGPRRRTGCVVDGALHGPGTVRFPNGDVYEGSLDRGRRSGAGTLGFADGRRYSGTWADDRPEGEGVFTYPNGDRYEGNYRRGLRHGQGVLTTHAGARYDGEWASDREHGQGRREWPDGRIYEGAFRDGRPHGAGRLTVQGGGVRVPLRAGATRRKGIGDDRRRRRPHRLDSRRPVRPRWLTPR